MRADGSCPAIVRWLIIGGGVLGLLVAIDAFAVLAFLLLASVARGPANPYSGLVAYVIVPALILIGLGAAGAAYVLWVRLVRNAELPAAHAATR